MKTCYISITIVFIVINSLPGNSQDTGSNRKLSIPSSPEDIVLVDPSTNLFQAGEFYISGQPTDSLFNLLKEKDLGLVINVRTPEEMEGVKEDGFDEEKYLDKLGIAYVNIPMGGDYGFSKQSISDIQKAIQQHEGTVMIHCRGAGRATNAWMAWLINYYNHPVNETIELGRHMQFSLYLEDLLGYELSFQKK